MLKISEVGKNIVQLAGKLGCETQVSILEQSSKDISVRQGEIEQLQTSRSLSTGVRLFSGNKNIILAFSGYDFDNMEEKIKLALEDMTYLEDDKYKRLLNREELEGDLREIALDDGRFDEIDIPQVTGVLKEIEATALDHDPRIRPSEAAEFSAARAYIHIFSSFGLDKFYNKSHYSFYYSAVAEEKGLKEVDSWYLSKRFFEDINNPIQIGSLAAQRVLKKLGGKKIKSGEQKVLFSPRTASSILELLAEALDGEEILLGNSFLSGSLGESLFAPNITIEDNPFMERHPGSYPFDGEGMTSRDKKVIREGKVLSYLHNSFSAAKLDMPLTGNASLALNSAPGIKTGNFYLKPGSGNLDDLLSEMKTGLLVEELFLSGMNSVTGDFSFGCAGYWVENGVSLYPVKEITIAGNLLELFRNIELIGDDNEWKSSICSPSFLVTGLSVGGI